MFLIRMKIVGNCVISDLDQFMIYSGNDRIFDLEEYFSSDQIQNSMRAPGGSLSQMINGGIIEKINPSSIDYKTQKRMEKQAREMATNGGITNKPTVKQMLEAIRQMSADEAKNKISNDYFDNLSVLDAVILDKTLHKDVRDVAAKCMHENLNKRIDQKFVLI